MSQSYYARSEASAAGATLAAAREELNLSVVDVARHLKLTPAQVEALEEGAYEKLPGRVFVRGFLRNYAKLLGLDPQPLLRRIEHEMPTPRAVEEPPAAPEAVMPTGEPSRWPLYAGVAAIVIAALAAYEFGFNAAPSDEGAASPGSSGGAPGAAEGIASSASQSLEATASQAPPGTTPAAAKPQALVATPNSPPLSAPAPSTRAVDATANDSVDTGRVPAPGQRELVFRFEQDSWVEIRDRNDKVIFSKLNRAGSEERVAGAPPLKLVVGNARGVQLSYDQRPVDLTPHIGVTVARLTLE